MKTVLLFLFSILPVVLFSQEFNFEIENKNVNELIRYEEKIGSELQKNTSIHYSQPGIAQPIIYKREQHDIPDLLVYYTFSEKDSVMTNITYEWDVANFEDEEVKGNNKQSPEFQKMIVEKYRGLEKMITAQFGDGAPESRNADLTKASTRQGLRMSNTWKPDPNRTIMIYAVLCNYYEEAGLVTFNTAHRIRLSVNIFKN